MQKHYKRYFYDIMKKEKMLGRHTKSLKGNCVFFYAQPHANVKTIYVSFHIGNMPLKRRMGRAASR